VNEEILRCERCESTIEADDLRCPVCNLVCPFARSEDRPETTIDILRCSGCGAAMRYEVRRRAASCAFCGSVLEVERPDDPLEEAHLLLPFTVDRARARAAFRDWLASLGWFRPRDLVSGATLENLNPLRWVGWVFDAHVTVSWAADTDRGANRSDWAPHAGQVELVFDDIVAPATRGLTRAETARLVSSYKLAFAGQAEDVVDDATVERFDMPRSAARHHLTEIIEALVRQRLSKDHIPGTRVRNLHTATVLRGLDTRRVAFPAWVLAYRYKGRLYRTVLSGQDAECLVGEAPFSATKIVAVVVAAAAALAVFALILLA
jgi:hypothetical protein